MNAVAAEHGTYATAQQCRKRPEGACDDCKAARNAYMREYRATHQGAYEWERAKESARDRARRQLAHLHPDEFQHLYDIEMGNT